MKDKKPSLKRNSYSKRSHDFSKNLKIDNLSLNKINLRNTSLKQAFNKIKADNKILSNTPPKTIMMVIAMIILLILFITTININSEVHNETEEVKPVEIMLGNNSIGSVTKLGPYGNTTSNITIAYILGVHPREKGAHKLMEDALMQEKENNLSYCYYIYKVNVTQNPTEFDLSRMNGQLLAQDFVVPDIINNSFNLAVDCHYSDGSWGVERFLFTPREDNIVSKQVADGINNTFDWITYFMPDDPSSPSFVTGPINDGGVPAILYEAYTGDANNTTLEHDKQLIQYIDKYNFTTEE